MRRKEINRNVHLPCGPNAFGGTINSVNRLTSDE
jgi:hypothetical protein